MFNVGFKPGGRVDTVHSIHDASMRARIIGYPVFLHSDPCLGNDDIVVTVKNEEDLKEAFDKMLTEYPANKAGIRKVIK